MDRRLFYVAEGIETTDKELLIAGPRREKGFLFLTLNNTDACLHIYICMCGFGGSL